MPRLSKTLIALLLPILATAQLSDPFVLKIQSTGAEIDGRYIKTEIRDPTFGTNVVFHKSAATQFMLNTTSGMIYSDGTPDSSGMLQGIGDIGEQTVGVPRGRVYFADPAYYEYVQSTDMGFDPLLCSMGSPVGTDGYVAFSCTSGGKSDMFGCRGRGEASGWFIYDLSESIGTHRHGKCTDMTLLAGPPATN